VNLARFATPGRGDGIDWEGLARCVEDGVRFLDDVLDVNAWPLPQIAGLSARNRKIGLGVMGWADLLVALGIPYDAPEALALGDRVMGHVQETAHRASEALARERGPFPGFSGSALARAGLPPRRNATVTTIAPTGTLALIAGCSSGIEPLFALSYVRHALGDAELREEHPALAPALRAAGAEAALPAVRAAGRARGVPGVPAPLASLLATALDVSPEAHVRMQAAFQRHVDNGVSKTVNLPRSAGVDEVAQAYRLAFELGCKGITVYRDGSRERQVLVSGGALEAVRRCPSCEGTLVRSGGCLTCAACGWGSCETTE
jgi:ribonucleoside-diphosphate reductase alpha chain